METNGVVYRQLTDDRVEDALRLQARTMKEECVAIGVGIPEEPGAAEAMQLVFKEVVKDGVTMIAVDVETDALVAVAFNKLQSRPQADVRDEFVVFMEENLKHRSCVELVKFLDYVESVVDVFEKCDVDHAMELFYIGTDPGYQGRGIGRKIVEASIQLGRDLSKGKASKHQVAEVLTNPDVLPEAVFGVFASRYSQRIVEKLGFQFLAEVRYDDHLSGGKRMSERIGETHQTARLAALKL